MNPLVSPMAALGSAATLGVADFTGGVAGRRSSPPSVALSMELVGLVAIPLAILLLPSRWDLGLIGYTFLGGMIGGFGLILFYRAMALNLIGIVAPITGVIAAALPATAGVVFGGERLHLAQVAGIVAGLVAIGLINGPTPAAGKEARSAVGMAIIAGVAFGLFFILFHAGSASGVPAFLTGRLGSAIVSLCFALVTRVPFIPLRATLRLIGVAGTLDGVGVVLYMYATLFGLLSISAVLTSFYPAFTVLCARVFLHERLTLLQTFGAATAVVAIALIAAG
ncbi:MAG TPA: DMT family transporter [Candidatus Acidoferrum sp.]|nr:DMT family transporter [Candidatus Acidoferrum sp.]